MLLFAKTSMALAPNGTYMIEAKMGDIYDPDTQKPINQSDLASGIAEYLVNNGLQEASMELAADEVRRVTDDKRHFLAESEVIFSRTSDLILKERETGTKNRIKEPALV